jgi:hypothetical protein
LKKYADQRLITRGTKTINYSHSWIPDGPYQTFDALTCAKATNNIAFVTFIEEFEATEPNFLPKLSDGLLRRNNANLTSDKFLV